MKTFLKEHGYLVIAIIVASVFAVVVKTANVKSIKDNEKVWISDMNTNCVNTISAFNDGFEQKSTVNVSKGDIITIDSKEYRVLEVNGTEAKLLAMYDAKKMKFNDSSVKTYFDDDITGQKYKGSKIDNYLENTFYPSLSFKKAIIEQNIAQNMYELNGTPADASYTTFSGTSYTTAKTGHVSVGSRHVYVLDVKDIISYLGTSWTPQQLNMMFYNTDSAIDSSHTPYHYAWLRSADASSPIGAWVVFGDAGYLNHFGYSGSYAVRPAFVIDITKVEYKLK